jgi:hypothetical protein
MAVRWDIRREGRPWRGDEFPARWELTPEKFETLDGRIFLSENDRINLLALLLENIGVDAAVRLGSLEVWEAAVSASRGALREEVSRRPGGWEDGYNGEFANGEIFPPGPRSPEE